jgi:sterol-4alpha-carboxylate 3-dehydrogenase (decarboxylating)
MQVNPKLAGFRVGDDAAAVTDHTYVANAAHAALLAADRLAPAHPQHPATAGAAFFITDGAPRPLWDFMRDLWVAAGGAQPPPLVAGKGVLMFASGVKDVVGLVSGGKTDACKQMQFVFADRSYDIGLAREVLGYKPIVSHEEGIRRVAEVRLCHLIPPLSVLLTG